MSLERTRMFAGARLRGLNTSVRPRLRAFIAGVRPRLRGLITRAWIRWQSVNQAQAGLLAIVLVAALVALVFALWPQLDLTLSALFYDAGRQDWPWAREPAILALRGLNEFVSRAIVAVAVIALIFAAAGGRTFAVIPPRVALFLLAALALGPGLIVNGILKAFWSRPRPVQVSAFGGALDFVPWWSPLGRCASNCSFVSGEVASAFCLLAVAVVLPARYRPLALAGAIVYGLAIAFVRVAMGGHFLSDALFAGLITALVVWLLHRVMLPPA